MSENLQILKVHEVNKTDMVERFLLEMLLTQSWSNEFNHTLVEYDDESESWHIADYLYKIGLLDLADSNNLKYEVSVIGRKYLERHR